MTDESPLFEIRYNNTPGRLHAFLMKIQAVTAKGAIQSGEFAQHFGLPGSTWPAPIQVLADAHLELADLHVQISELKDDVDKYETYKEELPSIDRSVRSITLENSRQNTVVEARIEPEALTALRFMAVNFQRESEIPAEEFASIIVQIDSLNRSILDDEEIKGEFRKWLLTLVRIMRDSLSRYQIRRGKGMKDEIHKLVGQLSVDFPEREELTKKHPDTWASVSDTLTFLFKAAKVVEVAANIGVKILKLDSTVDPEPDSE